MRVHDNNGRLADKVAIIAGAGGGMGRAVPLWFAAEGARVMLVARRAEPLEMLASKIRDEGGQADYVTADLTTIEGAVNMAEATLARWGQIDVLFDNLGDAAASGKRLHETDEEAWRYLMEINLNTAYVCTHAVLPHMQSRKQGSIILVSAAGATRQKANAGYGAAKAGLLGLTRNIARQYRDDGIRVNCICPGGIGDSRGEEDAGLPPSQLLRSGHPADIALASVFLASDESAWITGVSIDIDGGESVA
ncbi:MAG: SDR family NAD(P)-dependent oxidoreductase [Candidatus Poribacteria bacterium]|nr:SDR family NAD(P)-dependent oxidoreductase [Candidatus Poribacteria bacterium]